MYGLTISIGCRMATHGFCGLALGGATGRFRNGAEQVLNVSGARAAIGLLVWNEANSRT